MPWRTTRWWSTLANPRSAYGRRRRRDAASSGVIVPARTSSRSWRRAGPSIAPILPRSMSSTPARPRIGFLGPPGTFGEEALLTQADYADADIQPFPSHAEIINATERGDLDLGLVGFENSIEGSVRSVLDHLIFQTELLIQREVVLPISQNVLAPPGVALADVRRIVSFPDAMEQCREFFSASLPDVELVAASSTAE